MEGFEFDDLLSKLNNDGDGVIDYDYEGYAIVDDLKLSKEDIKQAVDIMWEIVMTTDTKQRENTYLFAKGLIKSKNLFLEAKAKEETLPENKKEVFKHKENIFRQRLENVKPLVDFLIKMKEVI
ncbi:hypothetical protein PANI_CDS0030 [Maribacter phage Panino]